MDRLGGGEIGATDGEEIGAEGSYVIILGESDLVYGHDNCGAVTGQTI